MKLKSLLSEVDIVDYRGDLDLDIKRLVYDSRKVEPGDFFIALPGHKQNGRDYVKQAAERKAVAALFEGEFFDNLNLAQIRVSGARRSLAILSANFYDHPSRSFYLTAVTGTNGKTSLTYLLKSLWKKKKTGILGTINYSIANKIIKSNQTTPESLDLQSYFQAMKENGVSHAAIEVSSHALIQERTFFSDFNSAVFTNLSHDHLDYHGTMENYYLAKKKLFLEELKENPDNLALICREDEWGRRLINELDRCSFKKWTYGFQKDNDYYPKSFHFSKEGLEATIQTPFDEMTIKAPLIGRFNCLNLMAAIAIAFHSGLSQDEIIKQLPEIELPPGRLERIGDSVFVDYAHTPDALRNVLTHLKEIQLGRLILVFGCGGDRDQSKRSVMGEVAATLSDLSIITSDNPRTENPQKIINDILSGFQKNSSLEEEKDYFVEIDREKAIRKAIEIMEGDDICLIAGKGHEDYQIIGHQKYHFSDKEIVQKYL